MSGRTRLLVAVVLERPLSDEVNGLRRALGATDLDRIQPHITLVPPINVERDGVDAALGHVRDVVARARPLEVTIGPARTFAPERPVVFLDVRGATDRLDDLRRALVTGAFEPPPSRPERPFRPHVTVRANTPDELIAPALQSLSLFLRPVVLERVSVLEQRDDDLGRRWQVIAEVALGRVGVVGTGGRPVRFAISSVLTAEVRDLIERELVVAGRDGGSSVGTAGLVAEARVEGALVAAATCRTVGDLFEIETLVVESRHRREGIAGQLLSYLEREASARGVRAMVAVVPTIDEVISLFEGRGFRRLGERPDARAPGATVLVRELVAPT